MVRAGCHHACDETVFGLAVTTLVTKRFVEAAAPDRSQMRKSQKKRGGYRNTPDLVQEPRAVAYFFGRRP